MGKYSLYKIPLKSLETGTHQFDYNLTNKFFELIDDGTADVKKGDLNVTVVVKKTVAAFDFNFTIAGNVNVPCDRCLDTIVMDVNTSNKLIVKFGKEYSEESDEIVIIPEEDGEINIAWFLYEFIVLSLPTKRVHPAGSCNKAMSSKLNKHKVTSTSEDDEALDEMEDEEDSSSDPRWDALSDINIEED